MLKCSIEACCDLVDEDMIVVAMEVEHTIWKLVLEEFKEERDVRATTGKINCLHRNVTTAEYETPRFWTSQGELPRR